jgi:hypothetical protein
MLADANDVFWIVSAWQARDPMQAFVGTQPYLATMARLDDWCDEATFVDLRMPMRPEPSPRP